MRPLWSTSNLSKVYSALSWLGIKSSLITARTNSKRSKLPLLSASRSANASCEFPYFRDILCLNMANSVACFGKATLNVVGAEVVLLAEDAGDVAKSCGRSGSRARSGAAGASGSGAAGSPRPSHATPACWQHQRRCSEDQPPRPLSTEQLKGELAASGTRQPTLAVRQHHSFFSSDHARAQSPSRASQSKPRSDSLERTASQSTPCTWQHHLLRPSLQLLPQEARAAAQSKGSPSKGSADAGGLQPTPLWSQQYDRFS
mmetsp:Transcript_86679/g.250315  ORF Transcript_86679/g.250315 Transcript_86679/m.250315 type:complete len:259 (-) Transcript_86679:368-1144(-)